MNMEDIKIFAKNEKELETQIKTIKIFSQDVKIELAIENCAMLIMRNGKTQIRERIELPKSRRIRSLERQTNKPHNQ